MPSTTPDFAQNWPSNSLVWLVWNDGKIYPGVTRVYGNGVKAPRNYVLIYIKGTNEEVWINQSSPNIQPRTKKHGSTPPYRWEYVSGDSGSDVDDSESEAPAGPRKRQRTKGKRRLPAPKTSKNSKEQQARQARKAMKQARKLASEKAARKASQTALPPKVSVKCICTC